MQRGTTLVEAAALLALMALALSVTVPSLQGVVDDLQTLAARERVAGLIAQVRAGAIGRGGAQLVIDSTHVVAFAPPSTPLRIDLGAEFGVAIDLGRRSRVALGYDALGVGRFANATIRFRRGDAERALVVSGYGRVRRR